MHYYIDQRKLFHSVQKEFLLIDSTGQGHIELNEFQRVLQLCLKELYQIESIIEEDILQAQKNFSVKIDGKLSLEESQKLINIIIQENLQKQRQQFLNNNKNDRSRLQEVVKQNLSRIAINADSYNFSYVNLNIQNQDLTNLYDVLPNYRNLRYIDLSNNQLEDISSVMFLPYLLHLNASNNKIKRIDFLEDRNCLLFLQNLNLSGNQITQLYSLGLPKLQKLNLNNNLIECISQEFTGHQNLRILEMRSNKLKSVQGLQNMQSLIELYLAENQIESFQSLHNLPNLKKLHLRQNNIEIIDQALPELPLLYHLNLRQNKISSFQQFRNLVQIQSLKSLTSQGNPICDETGEGSKKEILMILPSLTRCNKDEIGDEERNEAIQELKERIRQEEEKKREEEEKRREEEEQKRIEEEQKRKEEEEEKKRLEEEQKLKEEQEKLQSENQENQDNNENNEEEQQQQEEEKEEE